MKVLAFSKKKRGKTSFFIYASRQRHVSQSSLFTLFFFFGSLFVDELYGSCKSSTERSFFFLFCQRRTVFVFPHRFSTRFVSLFGCCSGHVPLYGPGGNTAVFFFSLPAFFFFETPFLFSLSYRDPCRFYFYFCKLAYSSPPVCFRIRRKILSKQQTQSAAWPFFPPLFVRVCVFQLAGALLFLFSLFLSAFFYLFHFLLLIMELSSSASCNAFTPPQAHPRSTSACLSLSLFICDLESS